MKKILIVDDHSVVRAGIESILQYAGMQVTVGHAANGVEALERLADTEWDLVLLDINMPIMNGSETLLVVRRKYPALPVMVISVYPDQRYALQMHQCGARGYLQKDFLPDDLVTAVETVLDGGTYFPAGVPQHMQPQDGEDDEALLHARLTQREFDVFRGMCKGHGRAAIADALSLSTTTVSKYRARIREKLRVSRNADVVAYAVRNGLID